MESERYGTRDITYITWHRTPSLKRFVPLRDAWRCGAINIDSLEYDRMAADQRHVALIEDARYVGQTFKAATRTARLAEAANLPAFVTLWERTEEPIGYRKPCPYCNGSTMGMPEYDIDKFRLAPANGRNSWQQMDPQEYAQWLVGLRLGDDDAPF